MTNAEVQRAIEETFHMWCDLDNPDPSLLRHYLERLLALQAERLRMTLELEGERFFEAIKEQCDVR